MVLLLVLAITWGLASIPFCVLIGRSIAAAGATLTAAEVGAARRAGERVAGGAAESPA